MHQASSMEEYEVMDKTVGEGSSWCKLVRENRSYGSSWWYFTFPRRICGRVCTSLLQRRACWHGCEPEAAWEESEGEGESESSDWRDCEPKTAERGEGEGEGEGVGDPGGDNGRDEDNPEVDSSAENGSNEYDPEVDASAENGRDENGPETDAPAENGRDEDDPEVDASAEENLWNRDGTLAAPIPRIMPIGTRFLLGLITLNLVQDPEIFPVAEKRNWTATFEITFRIVLEV